MVSLSAYRRPSDRAVLMVVLLIGGTMLGSELLQGWFPHDEGALGQSAERVLNGEVPHRDFDEIYTGLLSYLNAGMFAALGVSSVVLRLPLFVSALCWLCSMYRIALRFAPAEGAGLVALTAFVWGVPNYPAAMPSWYILFAATFATHALLRWHESGERRWLVVAGTMGGLAFLFKLSGIFVFLGGGLAIVAAAGAPASGDRATGEQPRRGMLSSLMAALLVGMVAALAWIVGRAGTPELVRHALPVAVVSLAIAATLIVPRGDVPAAGRALLGGLLPFAAGGLAPIALWFVFYAAVGGVPELVEGVFVTPFRRVEFAAVRPPDAWMMVFGLPLALVLWIPSAKGSLRVVMPVLAAVLFAVMLGFAGHVPWIYVAGWLGAWSLLFIVAVDGARLVVARRPAGVDVATDTDDASRPEAARRGAISVACMAVALSLIEYPFASPIYTLYVQPMILLAAAASVRAARRTSTALQLIVAIFLLVYGATWIVPGMVHRLGFGFVRSDERATLELPRGGLKVQPATAVVYEDVIRLVQERAKGGGTLWAGPDAPEIYFYSGLPNRTRTFFDFFDDRDAAPRPLVERLDSLDVSIVVLKLYPEFSTPPTETTIQELRRVFPHQQRFLLFLVAWR